MKPLSSLFSRSSWRDFNNMGRGIEGRYARCASYWQNHLALTKNLVSTELGELQSEDLKLAILGAGRLYDLDFAAIVALARRFKRTEIHLFDLDASALPVWRELKSRYPTIQVIFRREDITGVMIEWSKTVKSLRARSQLSASLDALSAPLPSWRTEGFTAIISLNILGQIPLYWRDRVISWNPAITVQESNALERSMGKLQLAHLKALEGIGGEHPITRIVFTDTEYYFYTGEESHWRVEPALFCDAVDAWRAFSNVSKAQKAWLWHIAPQFIEKDEYGEIHRVEAVVR